MAAETHVAEPVPIPEASSSPRPKKKIVQIRRFQIGLNVLIQFLVLLAIVLMVNYVAYRHFKRWDFSRDQKYALTTQTTNLVKNLKKPVRAVIFFSSAAEIAPDVKALLREYEFASDKKFTTEEVDPFRSFTRANELQAKYKFGANENILILDCDGKSKFVNAADMAEFENPDQMSMMMGMTQPKLKAFKGEQAITSALIELTEGKPNKVYFVSGHGEPDLKGDELKVFNESLKRQNIQVDALNLLNVSSIPEDTRALIIDGPKYDLSELEMKLLTDFWEKNGRLLVLVNPFSRTPRLTDWISHQGIVPQDDRVIRTGTFLSQGEDGTPQLKTGVINNAAFVVKNSGTKITKDLESLSKQFLGTTESLKVDNAAAKAARVRVTALLESGEGFWGETEVAGAADAPAFFDPKKDHMGPLTLAATAEKGGVDDPRVKVDTSRLVVFGNAELLSNNGYRLSEGVSVDLAMNSLNWLLDREELMGIPPKEKKNVTISLDEKQLRNLAIALMVFIPGIAAAAGFVNALQRRS